MMSSHGKAKRILLFSDWFEPAYKAGGPIRSCLNFVLNLEKDFDIFVVTGDRDLNDSQPLKGIQTGVFTKYKNTSAQVLYAEPQQLNFHFIRGIIESTAPDFIYLNSFFSKYFAVYPLLIKRFRHIKPIIVLAPRGMLKPSALRFKSVKKKVYIHLFRFLNLHRYVRFHATDENEMADIKQLFKAVAVFLIPNFPGTISPHPAVLTKKPGHLSIIFVGRIHPIKNLDFLLTALQTIKAEVKLSIVGVMEQVEYWQYCESMIRTLPSSIEVSMKGEVPNSLLASEISKHHIFALPTKGENFGHAIFEALGEGKPVLISDQTPWRNLQADLCGWDLNLEQPSLFSSALQQAADWDQTEYNLWSGNAYGRAKEFSEQTGVKENYKHIFS